MTLGRFNSLRRAFTLLELLVVIIIIAIVTAISVPAFSALLYTANESQAANQLQVALRAARDAAVRSTPGSDAAAVFFHDPAGRVSVIVCGSVGVLRDVDPDAPTVQDRFVEREIFVPVAGIEPVTLPRDWMVRGFAPRGSLHSDDLPTGWYDLGDFGNGYNETATYEVDEGNWIAPETGFYDKDVPDSGKARQSFMVRFEGGTGRQNVADTRPVLVLAPSESVPLRQQLALNDPMGKYRVDQATDKARFVQAVLAAPVPGLGLGGPTKAKALTLAEKQQILGDESVDTVLVRPLNQIALFNVQRMAATIGARGLNPDTQSLYLPVEPGVGNPFATYDTSLFDGLSNHQISLRIREWIEDRYLKGPGIDPNDREPSDARVFGVRRYDGSIIELTGTKVQS